MRSARLSGDLRGEVRHVYGLTGLESVPQMRFNEIIDGFTKAWHLALTLLVQDGREPPPRWNVCFEWAFTVIVPGIGMRE
jgi:hypothetical protein